MKQEQTIMPMPLAVVTLKLCLQKKICIQTEEDVQICAVDIYNTKVITNHNYFTTCFFV